MSNFMMFLLGFIPALAFATHSYADYRMAKGKPVGRAFNYFYKTLAALVVLEMIVFALVYIARK
ncbi:hypothetical protein EMIT0P74_100300 [Pseudomonas sp. IT-P74]|uniref:hypothetical protein n=1 Tax=Pseudomonas sp. IT-P74 TaxID=3026445 RepID=UPI0039E18971